MSGMFLGCTQLLSLPDISKWNTNNVTNMSGMFLGCTQLSSLPDISNWNTNNVTDMSSIFSDNYYHFLNLKNNAYIVNNNIILICIFTKCFITHNNNPKIKLNFLLKNEIFFYN